jgi:DNA-binding MarR family transcriptional regulator
MYVAEQPRKHKHTAIATDRVECQLELLHQQFPGLDYSAKALTGRFIRLGILCVDGLRRAVAPFGLTPNEYVILSVLRSAGAPCTLPPRVINSALILTSGALTNILNALEKKGLVQRQPDPNDSRGVLIRLTPKAMKIAERATAAHVREEHRLIASLTDREKSLTTAMLRKLLVALDPVHTNLLVNYRKQSNRRQRKSD